MVALCGWGKTVKFINGNGHKEENDHRCLRNEQNNNCLSFDCVKYQLVKETCTH